MGGEAMRTYVIPDYSLTLDEALPIVVNAMRDGLSEAEVCILLDLWGLSR
jgi:hypothetical protein